MKIIIGFLVLFVGLILGLVSITLKTMIGSFFVVVGIVGILLVLIGLVLIVFQSKNKDGAEQSKFMAIYAKIQNEAKKSNEVNNIKETNDKK